jgi:PAS domain S-box-containing protein
MSEEGNRAQEALTSGDQEIRLLVETIPTLVWRAAPDGNFDYVNKRMLEYLGSPLSDVIGWGWMEKVHPDDVGFKVRSWLQNLESGKPHDVVCRIRGADGRYRWFEVRGEPLRAGDGAVLSWYGILIDIDDRRKAENALRESEYDLRQIIEMAPGLIWSTGPDGEPTHVNQRMLEYSGMRFEDFKHRGWEAFVHPADYPETAKAFYHEIQTGTSYEGVLRLRRADGEFRWHHVRCEPLRGRQGRIIQWYGLPVDIDEAKKAEERPRSAAQLQATLNVIPAYTWYAAPSGGLTFVNKRTGDYLGLPKDHPLRFGIDIGTQWNAHIPLLHPDDQEGSRKAWSTCLSTGEAAEFSQRVRNAEGGYRWFLSRAEPLRASDGTVLQWVGVNLDIEELKCAEQALRRSEAYLAEAQRLSHTGSFGWTPSTGELHWSDEIFRILEYDPSIKPTIERVLQRIHPDDLAMMRRVLDETSRGEKDFDITHRLLMPDSSVKFVHVLSRVLKDAAGNPEIVGSLMDVTENTRLYRDLAEREARIRRLVDSNIIGIFTWEADGRIREANDAFLHMVGYDRKDVVSGQVRWTDLTPNEWRERDERAVPEWKSTGTVQPYEKEYFRKDGSRVPVLVGAANFEESGSQGVAFVLDLTERKEAEDRLRRSEAYLAEAQRLSHTGSAAYNDTTILYWSDENYRIFAFDPREGLPSREAAVERIHPDDREQALEEGRRAVREKRDYKLEYRLLLPDRTVKHIESTAHPKFSASGELIEIFNTIIDVTERKRAEEERKTAEEQLRLSEARLAEAQRLSHSGVAAYDETTILYGSEETYRIWGFDPAQGVPSREAVNQRIHPDDRNRVLAEVQRAVAERRDYSIGFRIVLPDGTARNLESIGRPRFSASGELVEIVVTHLDVTERKRAEEEHERLRQLESDLAHMNRLSMMGELAASLAHEITQPIAAGRNNARAALNFLDQQPPDLGEVREALGCVVGDADRAGQIVDRIRDHIKKAPPRKHRFDLNEAINEVIVLARSAMAENGVSIQTRLKEGLMPVKGDRVQLQQVVLNLALNAAEAMSAVDEGARELLISSEQSRTNGVLVAVRDSGPGIDPEHIERVFDAFYTTKSSGVGMGLSICRSIIDAHGGRLWADANEPRGAVFQFTLPSAEGAHESSSDGSPN